MNTQLEDVYSLRLTLYTFSMQNLLQIYHNSPTSGHDDPVWVYQFYKTVAPLGFGKWFLQNLAPRVVPNAFPETNKTTNKIKIYLFFIKRNIKLNNKMIIYVILGN